MLRLRALECRVLTIPHTCMYNTYKAIYKLSKLKYPNTRTDGRTDICTPRAAFAAENKTRSTRFYSFICFISSYWGRKYNFKKWHFCHQIFALLAYIWKNVFNINIGRYIFSKFFENPGFRDENGILIGKNFFLPQNQTNVSSQMFLN